MQIIIPMSGFGERFRRYGYKIPKPLIKIDGIHMIGHVINLFPNESDFIFICNKEHLKNKKYQMEKIIRKYSPNGKVIGINPHKLGPGNAVLQAESLIKKEEDVIVNYCDFSCIWDWHHFKKYVKDIECDGAVPAYKGFHPHSLGNTNYAYILEKDGWMIDIKEKEPFTKNRMEEFASSGTYYFSSGKLLIKSINSLLENRNHINGEYYISLAYKEMVKKKKKVAIYELNHFFQWGTPQDLEEFLIWSKTFNLILNKKSNYSFGGNLLIPMAGMGKRFSNEGYQKPKPIIDVSGSPMILQALKFLPKHLKKNFVIRESMYSQKNISELLSKNYPSSKIHLISKLSDGQASSALIGCKDIKNHDANSLLTIAACDSGSIYNEKSLSDLILRKDIDIVVWCSREHINAKRNPEMFGWIDAKDDGKILKVSTKEPISDDLNEPIIIGTFTFKNYSIFEKSINSLYKRQGKINGEYYIDSCINDAIQLGYNCHAFEVEAFISWGTPNDLKTFEYWQSTLDKWKYHNYKMDNDHNIDKNRLEFLRQKFEKK